MFFELFERSLGFFMEDCHAQESMLKSPSRKPKIIHPDLAKQRFFLNHSDDKTQTLPRQDDRE
jgi:hypothetical protein